jgi:hypothetical protein
MLYYDLTALQDLPIQRWVIKDVVPHNGLVIVYGMPGCCKTFLVLDMALRVANNVAWCRKPIERPGLVVLVAAEGIAGIKSRIAAWHEHHGVPPEAGLVVMPLSFLLRDGGGVQQFISTVADIATKYHDHVSMVVFDTLARAAVGLDENSSKDISIVIAAADRIKSALHTTVVFVHHGGKDDARGMRGSSSLLGAVDTCIKVTRSDGGNQLALRVEKQKDGEPCDFRAVLKKVAGSAVATGGGDVASSSHECTDAFVMMGARRKDVYQIASESGRTVSEVRAAMYRVLRDRGDADLHPDKIADKYGIRNKNVLPLRTLLLCTNAACA